MRIPSSNLFKLTADLLGQKLETIFPKVEVVYDGEIMEGMRYLLNKTDLPVISLDRIYCNSSQVAGFLDLTRAVDENLNDIGRLSRNGLDNIDSQVQSISTMLLNAKVKDIQLWDDVVFFGETITDLIDKFSEYGINIKNVICGIAIGEGIDLIAKRNIQTQCVRCYDKVVDEVCQRDFITGAELGGRMLIDRSTGKILRTPYILPYGNPQKWASIPEDSCRDFSGFCIEQALIIWTEIDNLNSMETTSDMLTQKVVGMPERISIVRFLNESLKQIN